MQGHLRDKIAPQFQKEMLQFQVIRCWIFPSQPCLICWLQAVNGANSKTELASWLQHRLPAAVANLHRDTMVLPFHYFDLLLYVHIIVTQRLDVGPS